MKIKVMHIIETISLGGAEKRLINDLKYLNKYGCTNIVCHVFDGINTLRDRISGMGIPIYSLGFNKPYGWVKALVSLLSITKEYKPDLIHTQLFTADIYGRIIGKIMGIPVVSTIQSSVYEPGIAYFRSHKRQWLDSITGRFCNGKFIAVSEFVKKSAIKRLRFPEKDIKVIYNHVDTDKFNIFNNDKHVLREGLGLNENDTVLITVGKLNPPKGHEYLFKAVAILKKDVPSVRLLIVGDGPSFKRLQELRDSLSLQDSVLFLGNRNDVDNLLFLSDIFVFPSLSEGFPMALLEAMVSAKPCIAFNLGPMPELIKDKETGLLVEPKNPEVFSEAISSLIANPQIALRIGAEARKFVIEHFDSKKNSEALNNLYEQALHHHEN